VYLVKNNISKKSIVFITYNIFQILFIFVSKINNNPNHFLTKYLLIHKNILSSFVSKIGKKQSTHWLFHWLLVIYCLALFIATIFTFLGCLLPYWLFIGCLLVVSLVVRTPSEFAVFLYHNILYFATKMVRKI